MTGARRTSSIPSPRSWPDPARSIGRHRGLGRDGQDVPHRAPGRRSVGPRRRPPRRDAGRDVHRAGGLRAAAPHQRAHQKVATTGETRRPTGTSVWTIDDEARARDSARPPRAPSTARHLDDPRLLPAGAHRAGLRGRAPAGPAERREPGGVRGRLRRGAAPGAGGRRTSGPLISRHTWRPGAHGGQPGGAALPGASAARAVGDAVRSRAHRRRRHRPSRASRGRTIDAAIARGRARHQGPRR